MRFKDHGHLALRAAAVFRLETIGCALMAPVSISCSSAGDSQDTAPTRGGSGTSSLGGAASLSGGAGGNAGLAGAFAAGANTTGGMGTGGTSNSGGKAGTAQGGSHGGKGGGGTSSRGGGPSQGGAPSQSGSGGAASTAGAAGSAGAGAASCTTPVFVESDKQGQTTFPDGYMVFNNIWSGSGGPQTLYACSPSNWYVVSNQPVIANSRGEIKSYPCSKWDFGGKPLDKFQTITSRFASFAPAEGVWNAAYDIWLGPSGWDIEVMVWTDYRYLATLPPGGALATGNPTIDGIEYTAWTYGPDYIGLAMKQKKTSGTLQFRGIFDWIVQQGWVPANAELHAFEYGVEIAETNGKELTFGISDFSVSGQ